MPKVVERFEYTFSEIVLMGTRQQGSYSTTWYIECPECNGKHQFHKQGSKMWQAQCRLFGVEWTVTPREYYVKKPIDLTSVMGEM